MDVVIVRSNPVSPDPRVERAANALGEEGYTVRVLAWDRMTDHPKLEVRKSYAIHRIRLRAPYGSSTLILRIVSWNLRELIYLLRSKHDFIHACDLDTLIPALIVAKLRRSSLVYDCFDFYADCLPKGVPESVRRSVAALEIALARKANLVILVDESRLAQFRNRLTNTVIIGNSPPEDNLPEASLQVEGAKGTLEIFYAGILDMSRGFGHIIRATEDASGVSIVVAGFGRDEAQLIEQFASAGNFRFLGKLSYEEVLQHSAVSDALIALYDPSVPNHRYACPNKLFEAMMFGKPIIVSDSTLMADIVRRENCGIVVPFGDVPSLRKAIWRLRDDIDFRQALGKNGRNAYTRKYSWKEAKARLVESYAHQEKGAT